MTNHSLVKDQSIAYRAWNHLKLFCGRISHEEIGTDNIDTTTFVQKVCQFVKKILENDVEASLLLSRYQRWNHVFCHTLNPVLFCDHNSWTPPTWNRRCNLHRPVIVLVIVMPPKISPRCSKIVVRIRARIWEVRGVIKQRLWYPRFLYRSKTP